MEPQQVSPNVQQELQCAQGQNIIPEAQQVFQCAQGTKCRTKDFNSLTFEPLFTLRQIRQMVHNTTTFNKFQQDVLTHQIKTTKLLPDVDKDLHNCKFTICDFCINWYGTPKRRKHRNH